MLRELRSSCEACHDPLNVPSALKPVLDALVMFGHLRGDTFNDVIVTTDQRKAEKGEEEHLEVVIATQDQ